MTWLTYLEETFKAMTDGPWRARTYSCGCCGYMEHGDGRGATRDDLGYVVNNLPAIAPMNAEGIITLANLRREILALIEAAIRFVPDERTIQWEKREVALREALTDLSAAVEKMREGK